MMNKRTNTPFMPQATGFFEYRCLSVMKRKAYRVARELLHPFRDEEEGLHPLHA